MEFADSFPSDEYLFYLKFKFGLDFDTPTLFTLDRIARDIFAQQNPPFIRIHCYPESILAELKDILTTLTMTRTREKDKKEALNRLIEIDPYGYYVIEEFMNKFS